MKTILKCAIAGTALLASAAFADVTLPSTGNGELVLFVRNATTGATYVRGLGLTEDSLLTSAAVVADAGFTRGEVVTVSGLPTIGPDANLSAFLNGSDTFQWTIMGGGFAAPVTDVTLGHQRFVTTLQAEATGVPNITNAQGSNLRNIASTMTAVNNSVPGATAGDGGSAVGANQWWSPTLAPNPTAWYGISGLSNINPLDSAANLYMLVTSGGGTNPMRLYQFNDVTLSANGTLSFAAPAAVPLPAAVWLMGSGLFGLFGIGRRRRA